MRITCPNCGAQYEVPDEVIPEAGRDVQCSNCTTTWFQEHPDFPVTIEDPEPEAAWPDEPEQEIEQESAQGLDPDQDAAFQEELDQILNDEPDQAAARRPLDQSVADVLREEAEREAQARAAAAETIETQTELGLESAGESDASDPDDVKVRIQRLRGEAPIAHIDLDPEPEPRSNLLPDIDEVNDTLDEVPDPALPENRNPAAEVDINAVEDTGKGGFRLGFWIIILIALLLTALYIMSPTIKDLVPAIAAQVDAYVLWVDGIRAWLSSSLANLMAKLDSLSSGASSGS